MCSFTPSRQTWGATLLYNRFGERLDGVGVGGMPDIYEREHGSLDASAWIRFRGLRWSLGATNLLDATQTWTQGDAVTRRTRDGRAVSLTVSRSG